MERLPEPYKRDLVAFALSRLQNAEYALATIMIQAMDNKLCLKVVLILDHPTGNSRTSIFLSGGNICFSTQIVIKKDKIVFIRLKLGDASLRIFDYFIIGDAGLKHALLEFDMSIRHVFENKNFHVTMCVKGFCLRGSFCQLFRQSFRHVDHCHR
jgi:hypothetical protein